MRVGQGVLRDLEALRRTHPALRLALVGLALLAIASLGRVVQVTQSPLGGQDLYTYWFLGHVLREARNPYGGAPRIQSPRLPVRYLDRLVPSEAPVRLSRMTGPPYITAPLGLILFQLAWASWPLAKWLFLAMNLAVIFWLPRWLLRSFPAASHLGVADRWLVQLALYASLATRVALSLGQTTPLVFVLMLATLLLKESSWALAGICLGLALSKYHVALPMVLLLLLGWRRRYASILATALLVQVLGAWIVSLWSGESIRQVIGGYVAFGQVVARDTRGLGWSLAVLVSPRYQGVVAALLIAAAAAGFLWLRRQGSRSVLWQASPMTEYHLWVILLALALVATYHGIYDMFMALAFLPLGLCAARRAQLWRLTPWQARLVGLVSLLLVSASVLPGSIVGSVLPSAVTQAWLRLRSQSTTFATLLVLLTASWLLLRWLGQAPRAQGNEHAAHHVDPPRRSVQGGFIGDGGT